MFEGNLLHISLLNVLIKKLPISTSMYLQILHLPKIEKDLDLTLRHLQNY